MGTFNRTKALQYAVKWALNRNPDFKDHSSDAGGGGDCTNFVSQCMWAGGWPMIRSMLSWSGPISIDHLWFGGPYVMGSPASGDSRTWAGAQNFADFIVDTHRASPCKRNDLAVGDIVGLQVEGDMKHMMIVTTVVPLPHSAPHGDRTDVYVSGHSRDFLNQRLSNIEFRYGRDTIRCWKVAHSFRL
jgi:hypothetical protein